MEKLLKEIKKYKEIYIIGHKNPDADSIFSSILLSRILNKLNIKSYAIILDDYIYSENDINLINDYIVEKPIVINKKDLKDKDIILVDHNDPEQSIGNGFNIIASIDHHMEQNKVYTLSGMCTSTALYIYDLFKEMYNFNEYEKKLIALATMTDSEYLTTTRYTENDKKNYESLNTNLNVLDIRNKYFKTTDFKVSPIININNNHKVYNIENKIINRTMIKAYKEDNKYIKDYLKELESLKGLWFMIWNEYDTNNTYIYLNNNLVKTYNYILTSSVIVIKDLISENIIK